MNARLLGLIDRCYLRLAREPGRRARCRAMVEQRTVESPRLVAAPGGRVLVVAPHPDDESIGCGGTVLAIDGRRERVGCLLMTGGQAARPDWSRARVADTRLAEMQACLDAMGVEQFTQLPGIDQRLHDQPELVEPLRAALAGFRPDALLLPHFMDAHLDHRWTNRLVLEAARGLLDERAVELWGYEVWSPCAANVAVDITPWAERKAGLIALHDSQDSRMGYSECILGLNRWRAMQVNWRGPGGPRHAEAFHRLPLGEYRAQAEAWFAASDPPALMPR